jgi:hypothetical protein
MNHLPVFHPGSSIVLRFRLRNRGSRSPVPPGDYRVRATLFTRLLGEQLVASTENEPGTLAATAGADGTLTVTVPPGESLRLPCGECSVRLDLTHRDDGTVLVITRKIFILQETVKTA